MTNRDIKPMVFYFTFDLSYHTDEESSVVKAFAVNKTGMEKVLSQHKIAADKDFAEKGDRRCTAFNYFSVDICVCGFSDFTSLQKINRI